jgi:hypothetical protein
MIRSNQAVTSSTVYRIPQTDFSILRCLCLTLKGFSGGGGEVIAYEKNVQISRQDKLFVFVPGK